MKTKFRAGNYMIPVELIPHEGRLFVKFPFNRYLIDEIKNMEGARWHGFEKPPRKIWSIADSPRNHFQMGYLEGKNPYAHYDSEIIGHKYLRPLYLHQIELADFAMTTHHCVIAGEMGVGKTLSAIEVMEKSGSDGWWYIAPRSGIVAVERELRIWKSMIKPRMITYAGLTKIMKNWESGVKAPRGVIFDESSRVKNYTAQRSQAAMALANGIRDDWGDKGYIILMSGAPAPKSPVDWWWQCEIACPGFLKEGSHAKFKKRLGVVVEKESVTGGVYPHLETWLDDEHKCEICGQTEETHFDEDHDFKSSKNEVSFLYERMKGLVLVKLKKDCLDLPDKIYRQVILEPDQKTINVAKSIVATASTVIAGITLLRELSDGFQYIEKAAGTAVCNECNGCGIMDDPLDPGSEIKCDNCVDGRIKKYVRTAQQVSTPKEEALRDILDEHIDIGRLVIFAGFTGSVDRCVSICKDCEWQVIRVDGRGWDHPFVDPLETFQNQIEKHPRVAFVGQPGAGGMGLTLTASPTTVYYSNDFNAENRVQSEDRIHRIGMDENRGATIIDLLHLATDQLILDNLKKKRKLQSLTLGELQRKVNENV